MVRLRATLLAMAMSLAAAGLAQAQDSNAVLGHEISLRACSSCHAVEPGTANDPARTRAFLIGWLMNPHPPMPNLSLTNAEIAALVAYLDSLKGRAD